MQTTGDSSGQLLLQFESPLILESLLCFCVLWFYGDRWKICNYMSFLAKNWKKFALHHMTVFSFSFFISWKVEFSPEIFFFHFHSFFLHILETKHLIRSSMTSASQLCRPLLSAFALLFLSSLLLIQIHLNSLFVSHSYIMFPNP